LVAGADFYASLPTEQLRNQHGANVQSVGTIQAFIKNDGVEKWLQDKAARLNKNMKCSLEQIGLSISNKYRKNTIRHI